MSVNPRPPVRTAIRALTLLNVFSVEEPSLGLSEISRRTGLAKATAMRLLQTLASIGYAAQEEDGAWRLGPATASLGTRYRASFEVSTEIELALRKLSDATREDASFFVRDGSRRVRLVRVINPEAQHGPSRVGESMSLDKGAAGKVILAALGEPGEMYDRIRSLGFHIAVGESRRSTASIAAPVFGAKHRVVGALSIGAHASEHAEADLSKFAMRLKEAAQDLSATLSYKNATAAWPTGAKPSTWHP